MHIEESLRNKIEAVLNSSRPDMSHSLGMKFLELTRNQVRASMPVNKHTVQPMRILHGGASVALAETLMSVGAWLNLDDDTKTAVGIEINANHLRPVPEGDLVYGTAIPLHRGAGTQVWETKITAENGKLVCISRCTVAVVSGANISGTGM